jgi:hypothetical protein
MNNSLINPEDFEEEEYQVSDLDELIPSDSHDAIAKQRLQREIEACARHIRPRYISAITAVCSGSTVAAASRKYHCAAQTLSNQMKSPYGERLLNAIRRLHALRDGTEYIQRELMLWRIAASNELSDPRTSIAAIAEINRTKADTPIDAAKAKENIDLQNMPQVIIQIADPRLVASPLDELPSTMKDIN